MNPYITAFLQILLVFVLVFLNGFFVAAEFAIVQVRSTRLAQNQTARGRVAQRIVANLDPYLSATQLGITLASLGLGWVGEPAIARLLEPLLHLFHLPEIAIHTISFIIAFSIITFLHIVIGEMAPKSLAIREAEKVTLWTAYWLNAFYRLFRPFIYVLNSSANYFLRIAGYEFHEEHQTAHTEEEIRMLIQQSHKSGMIDQTELALFDNVFDFTERVAREVMVPRTEMVCLYLEDTFEENLNVMQQANYTRFPLCGEDKDDIRGFIHIRNAYEMFFSQQQNKLEEIARPVVMVPETMEVKDVLRKLQKSHAGMAIVVDEYGGTSGLITTEDIIEEIFGEIQDEFDNEIPFFQATGEDTSIDGKLLIQEVNAYFQLQLEDEDNDTIGGWLFSRLNKIPEIGDVYEYNGYRFEVLEVKNRSIHRMLVKSLEQKKIDIENDLDPS
ncbi:hemolysin family protein [Risungbinella massiliensis]|uniref:hemolysin family protein n=1 Tax=Risungbinella massiliensis TaxID=1329796 RepID=UPI0005CB9150|nr:hemolysin family protein [Risungbinella massiliensis]